MKSKKPKISVIMPVHNTQDYLGEAIESILEQTFGEFEFIIIDDGSNDNSYDICEKYAQKDDRIRLYKNDTNQGIPVTRNRLVALATTNYIASQDSDDISLPNRLQSEYDFLQSNNTYAVVSGNNTIINEIGETIGTRVYSDDIKNTILKKSPVSQPASMFRKDKFLEVGGYDETIHFAEDYDLWLRIYSKGYAIKNLDESMIHYRIRSGQTKVEKVKQTLQNTLLLQKKAIKSYGIKPKFTDKIYHFLEWCLLFLPSGLIVFLFKKIEYKYEK